MIGLPLVIVSYLTLGAIASGVTYRLMKGEPGLATVVFVAWPLFLALLSLLPFILLAQYVAGVPIGKFKIEEKE